jgi:hypothetical protein
MRNPSSLPAARSTVVAAVVVRLRRSPRPTREATPTTEQNGEQHKRPFVHRRDCLDDGIGDHDYIRARVVAQIAVAATGHVRDIGDRCRWFTNRVRFRAGGDFSTFKLRALIDSSNGLANMLSRSPRNNLRPARCHRIMVFGRISNSAICGTHIALWGRQVLLQGRSR